MDKNTLIGGLAVAVIALIAYLFLSGQDTSGDQVAQADGFGPNGGEQVESNAPASGAKGQGAANSNTTAPINSQSGQPVPSSNDTMAGYDQAATVASVNNAPFNNGPDDIADTPMAPAQLIAAGSYSNCQILYTNSAVYNGPCVIGDADGNGEFRVSRPGSKQFEFKGNKSRFSSYRVQPAKGILYGSSGQGIAYINLMGDSSNPNCVTAGPAKRDSDSISICAR